MPLTPTRDVGKTIRKLKKEGGRPQAQIVAIALDVARRAGANIPKKKGQTSAIKRSLKK